MTAKKQPETLPLGSMWDLGNAKSYDVTRPDGVVVTVTGGAYVLSMPGVFSCGNNEVEAKA